MKVSSLLELAGGSTAAEYAVIDGGPMMGKIVSSDSSVTKTTGGIIILPQDHSLVMGKRTPWSMIVNRAKAVCCNCMACTDACPRYLLGHSLQPHRIMQAVGKGQFNEPGIVSKAFLCSECGACEAYGCTMGLSPRRVNGELKRQLGKAGIRNSHHAKPEKVNKMREMRRIPTKRLVYRLGLAQYDVPAPWSPNLVRVDTVRIPMIQHIGAPAKPVVVIGNTVKKGDLIAKIPEDASVGANIHASIDGEVVAINDSIVIRAL
jgi:Na+-translocating ferredoxin:NAD+ oxidoreductase RnfC subunit